MFYKSLFCSSGTRRIEEALDLIDPCVNQEMNNKLMSPVTRKEIKSAVFSLGGNKALGPMAFQVNFTNWLGLRSVNMFAKWSGNFLMVILVWLN